jgi:hypothetical protein
MENDEKQPEPVKNESFLARMQGKGKLTIRPRKPGELDMVEKLREAVESEE